MQRPGSKATASKKNPYHNLYKHIIGKKKSKPCCKAPKHVFSETRKSNIEAKVKSAMACNPGKQHIDLWQKELDLLWGRLTTEEKEQWDKAADDKLKAELEQWETEQNTPASKDPKDIQMCVHPCVSHF
jgi:hypothetical protein